MTGHPPQRPSRWLAYSGWGSLCLIASIGVHLALLGMPLPTPHQSSEAPTPEDTPLTPIAITVLPSPDLPPQLEPAPTVAPPPPAPVVTAVAPPPVALPGPPWPDSAPPRPAPEASAPPVEEPVVDPPPPAPPAEPVPFANFPHLEGAVMASCPDGGNCWQSPVSSWRSAATDLRDQLEAQGYTLDNITGEVLSTETGVRVYAVTKTGGDTYYLNLVSIGTGIVYSMTAEPITMDQVEALQGS